MPATLSMSLCLRMSLRVGIMLVIVDRPAHIILTLVDLLMLLRGQVAAIRCAIRRNLVIDARLTPFDVPRLTSRHLPGVNTLRNSLLLILSAHTGSGERRILRTPTIHAGKVVAIRTSRLHMMLLL